MKRPVEVLTPAEVSRLLRACSGGSIGKRNRALIVVMWRAGLRCGEALDLAPRDIDTAEQTIRIRTAKGCDARTVGLDMRALSIVGEWSRSRSYRSRAVQESPHFFCTLRGSPMSGSYVRKLMTRLGKRAGIEKRVHAHALRHTFAVELAREGTHPRVIQAALGHSSLATTNTYLAHVEPREMVETLTARRWAEG